MTTIHQEIQAACSPESVWALLADLVAVERYNPRVKRAAIEGAQRSGVGARRSCELVPGSRSMPRQLLPCRAGLPRMVPRAGRSERDSPRE
jgi:hypothetical protein